MVVATFGRLAEYWMFCTPDLLAYRYERCRVLARTHEERETVVKMLDRYLAEARTVARRQRVEGDEAGAEATALVIQHGHDDRYAGKLLTGRFQVMESLTPAGTYYVVDHTLEDLLVREAGPASNVRRFGTIAEAEGWTNRVAERSAGTATPAASRRAALNLPPSGAGRGATTKEYEMIKKVKAADVPAAKTNSEGRKRTGVGARARELIMAGKLTDDQIFDVLAKECGMDESKRSHISWYRYDLRRKGQNPPGPVGSTRASRGAGKAEVAPPALPVKAVKGKAPVKAVVAAKANKKVVAGRGKTASK